MSEEEPDIVPNAHRRGFLRDLGKAFRRTPNADKMETEIPVHTTPASPKNTQPESAQATGRGVSRRKFLGATGALAASAIGAPTSALDVINKTFGITSGLTGAVDNDAWLVEVAKLLEESWLNIAYNNHTTLPKGAFYHSHFFSGVHTEAFDLAISMDAGGCADLLHILAQNADDVEKLNKAGRLPLTNNPLLAQIFQNAAGTVAKNIAGNFQALSNFDMKPLADIVKPIVRQMHRKNSTTEQQADPQQSNWQDKIEAQKAADERAWYDYWKY